MAVVFHKYEDQATDQKLEQLYQNVNLNQPNNKILSDQDASALRLTTICSQTMAESVDKLAQFIANNCRLRDDIPVADGADGQHLNQQQLQRQLAETSSKTFLVSRQDKYSVWPMIYHRSCPIQTRNLPLFHYHENGVQMEPIWIHPN